MQLEIKPFLQLVKTLKTITDGGVTELNVLYIFPDVENRQIKVLGTDTTMTFSDYLPYTPTDTSDDSVFVVYLPALHTFLTTAENEYTTKTKRGMPVDSFVTLTYDKQDAFVEFQANKCRTILKKEIDNSEELSFADITEVHDTLTKQDLQFAIFDMLSFIDKASPNETATQLFLTKEHSVVGDDTFLTIRPFNSTAPYQFSTKAIQFLKRLVVTETAETYEFTYESEYVTHVRNGLRTFTFVTNDVAEPDQSVLLDFTTHATLTIDAEFLKIMLPLLKSDNDDSPIIFRCFENALYLATTKGSERTTIEVDAEMYEHYQIDIDEQLREEYHLSPTEFSFGFYADELTKHAKLLKDQKLTIDVDVEYTMARLKTQDDRHSSLLSVILTDELGPYLTVLDA